MFKSKVFFSVILIFISGMMLQCASVTITYDLKKIGRIASNQVAIWVEDASGKIVRNLYVTKFTGKGGYKARPQSLNIWITKSGWGSASKREIDAVTGATQKPGSRTITWDCRDSNGDDVLPGIYFIMFEGNIFWDKEEFAKCGINIGDKESKAEGIITYSSSDAAKDGILFSNVIAVFKP